MDTAQDILAACFLFQGADEALRQATALPAAAYARGQTIYEPYGFQRALGLVLRGRAEAVASAQEKAVLSVFRPGAVFGAAALFGGGERYVSRIRATTDCTVVFFPEPLLRQWFTDYPAMALHYIAFLTDRVRFLNGKIAILTQDSVEQRLYSWLCANCDEAGYLPKGVSMTKLSGLLSIGRTSLYRALDALAEKQLITKEKNIWRVNV